LQEEGKQTFIKNYHSNKRQTSNKEIYNFHSCTVRLDIIRVFYLPNDAQ